MKKTLIIGGIVVGILVHYWFKAPVATSAEKGVYAPQVLERRELVAGGKCVAKLTFTKGLISKVESETKGCFYGAAEPGLLVNKKPVLYVDSITFGDGTTTCYGPPNPTPAMCICTAKPCP